MDSIELVAHQLTEHALAIHRNVINNEGTTPPKTEMIKLAQAMLNLRVELEPGCRESASKKVIFTARDRLKAMPLNRDSERMIFLIMTDSIKLTFPSAGLDW